MNILIADSGSTKTDWVLCGENIHSPIRFASTGLNPCLMTDEEISSKLQNEVKPNYPELPIERIHFYGAGCRPDQLRRMEHLLIETIGAARAIVASDLLGTAHALCGREAGIVAILGTGSGSAVYNGERFTHQTPSLGFILGDEGSGAVLGRRLLGDVFKRQLSPAIIAAFEAECRTTIDEAIRRVYREAAPNRYLAGFTHFLASHREDADIHRLLVNEFRNFFTRNLAIYNRNDLHVNIVGSLAVIFEAELLEAATDSGFKIGKILRSPAEALAKFCLNEKF